MKTLWQKYGLIFCRGVAMGAADVVPGVSGGTIAFITGIYDELIDSLKSIDHKAVKCLLQRGPVAAWHHINGNFLAAVFAGILCSVFSLAKLITFLLDHYPVLVWSFFFGLILASIIHLGKHLRWQRPSILLSFGVGAAIALAISLARPATLPAEWWMLSLAGSIAICAMILPGISGSFILLLMGMYSVLLQAVTELNVVLLLSFLVGAVVGLLVFSHVLSWLLHRWHEPMLALLSGFLLGSLNVIWPWKQVIETRLDRHGNVVPLIQENVSPWFYQTVMGRENWLLEAFCLAGAGLFVVLIIEWGFNRQSLSQRTDES